MKNVFNSEDGEHNVTLNESNLDINAIGPTLVCRQPEYENLWKETKCLLYTNPSSVFILLFVSECVHNKFFPLVKKTDKYFVVCLCEIINQVQKITH